MKIGVLTSGGDAPGMNAALWTIAKMGAHRNVPVVGVLRGYEGLLRGETRPLGLADVDGISRFGGTLLGSARSAEFATPLGRRRAAEQLDALGIDALIVIGGNGSLTGAHLLAAETKCRIVGIPASIDNDVGHCGMAIGVDTAVNTIVEACDRISDTAQAHRRAFIVEVMGRRCGYLAMRAGLASEADAILYAERNIPEDELVAKLLEVIRRAFAPERGKRRVLVVKAEGVLVPTHVLRDRLQAHLDVDLPGVDIRETVLGHVVRGGNPSASDRLVAQRLGFAAMLAVSAGATDIMVSWDVPGDFGEATPDPFVRRVPLAEMIAETERLLDGTSPVTRGRVALLSMVEDLLAL